MNNKEEDIHILWIVENIDAVGAKAISRKIAVLGQQLMNSGAYVWTTLFLRRENILVTQSMNLAGPVSATITRCLWIWLGRQTILKSFKWV